MFTATITPSSRKRSNKTKLWSYVIDVEGSSELFTSYQKAYDVASRAYVKIIKPKRGRKAAGDLSKVYRDRAPTFEKAVKVGLVWFNSYVVKL